MIHNVDIIFEVKANILQKVGMMIFVVQMLDCAAFSVEWYTYRLACMGIVVSILLAKCSFLLLRFSALEVD
jgi:hypothetical protein